MRVAVDEEVSGSILARGKAFCSHKEKLIWTTAPEINYLACRSRAILPTFVGLRLLIIYFLIAQTNFGAIRIVLSPGRCVTQRWSAVVFQAIFCLTLNFVLKHGINS